MAFPGNFVRMHIEKEILNRDAATTMISTLMTELLVLFACLRLARHIRRRLVPSRERQPTARHTDAVITR